MSNNDARTAIEFVLLRPDLRRMTTEQVTDAIIDALTAANLLIVPRAVVESCRSTAICLNNAKLARALDECMPAADKQGAG